MQHWTTNRTWRVSTGRRVVSTTRIANRYSAPDELATLLRDNHFVERSRHGSWQGDPFTAESESMILVFGKA